MATTGYLIREIFVSNIYISRTLVEAQIPKVRIHVEDKTFSNVIRECFHIFTNVILMKSAYFLSINDRYLALNFINEVFLNAMLLLSRNELIKTIGN